MLIAIEKLKKKIIWPRSVVETRRSSKPLNIGSIPIEALRFYRADVGSIPTGALNIC